MLCAFLCGTKNTDVGRMRSSIVSVKHSVLVEKPEQILSLFWTEQGWDLYDYYVPVLYIALGSMI